MQTLGVLAPERFFVDTIRTEAGTVVKIRYPPLGLACEGGAQQQRQLEHRLRAEVARALLSRPQLVGEVQRWATSVDPQQVEFFAGVEQLDCVAIERQLQHAQGERLYLLTALALLRGCEVWVALSARPEVLGDPQLRALLYEGSGGSTP